MLCHSTSCPSICPNSTASRASAPEHTRILKRRKLRSKYNVLYGYWIEGLEAPNISLSLIITGNASVSTTCISKMTRHWITWDYLSHHIQEVPSPSSRFPVHLAVVPLYKTCRDLIDTLGPLVQFVHIEPDQLHISRMHQENTSFAFYYFSCFYHFSCTFYFTFFTTTLLFSHNITETRPHIHLLRCLRSHPWHQR